AGHVDGALDGEDHAREDRGGEGDAERLHAHHLDLLDDQAEVLRRQRQAAGDLTGQAADPAAPRGGPPQVGFPYSVRPIARLSPQVRNWPRHVSTEAGGATYTKS